MINIKQNACDFIKIFFVIFYKIVDSVFLYFINPSIIDDKSILLIRLDSIGDYILFRNFIKYYKEYNKDSSLTLIGNIIWKDLSENFDAGYIDSFIWVDRVKFYRNLFYRYKKIMEISSKGYRFVIDPTFTRNFFLGSIIIKFVNAKEKIGIKQDFFGKRNFIGKIFNQIGNDSKNFTKLISLSKTPMFEFNRNREFCEKLLGLDAIIEKPSIDLHNIKLTVNIPEHYVVLFIGAAAKYRKWPLKNFIEVAFQIKNKLGYEVLLCGSSNDSGKIKQFISGFENDIYNFVGKTSLLDLIYIISRSNLVISNETSVPHMAVALDIPVIVISNGNNLGRFVPYPKQITDRYYALYPPDISNHLDSFNQLVSKYYNNSNLDIKGIGTIDVINTTVNALKLDCKKC